MKIQTIIVPVDFSDCSHGVATQAASLARREGARLVLLHVAQPPSGLAEDATIHPSEQHPAMTVRAYLESAARRRLPIYERLIAKEEVTVELLVRTGRIAETILEVSEERGADLIVMGTHGRRGLARALLGSVAESVLRRAAVPVLTIRSEHQPHCTAQGCAWCTSGVTDELWQARAELDG